MQIMSHRFHSEMIRYANDSRIMGEEEIGLHEQKNAGSMNKFLTQIQGTSQLYILTS